MDQALAERLAASGIQVAAETETHSLLTRDNCIALVERQGGLGSTGLLTENGLSYLVWRDGQAFLKSKIAETVATEEQLAVVQTFSRDVAAALR